MPPATPWTPEQEALLGTAPDTEIAARIGYSVDACRRQRHRLGIAAFTVTPHPCRICGELATWKVGLCHTHGERWRRWGKPPVEEWVAAFRAECLNTCAECGRQWNGYHGCRHCSPECLETHKRKESLAHWHRRTPESKAEAKARQLARLRTLSTERKTEKICPICRESFVGLPHRVLCGKPECRSKNTTRGSRAYRHRRAQTEAATLGAELQRRLTGEPTPENDRPAGAGD